MSPGSLHAFAAPHPPRWAPEEVATTASGSRVQRFVPPESPPLHPRGARGFVLSPSAHEAHETQGSSLGLPQGAWCSGT